MGWQGGAPVTGGWQSGAAPQPWKPQRGSSTAAPGAGRPAPAPVGGTAPLSYMYSGQTGPAALNQSQSTTQARRAIQPPAATPPYGSESGPTYVEDRYTSRANGTDPGWEYSTGRAQDQINRQYAARGGYNSSGATQSLGDMYANATSQREGQLDTLSNEATSAHQNALNSMFTQGNNIASGQSGVQGAYDSATGGAMSDGMQQQLQLFLSKMGVDPAKSQGELNTLMSLFKTGASAAGGKGGA